MASYRQENKERNNTAGEGEAKVNSDQIKRMKGNISVNCGG